MALALMRLGGFGLAEALSLTWDEATAWLECAAELEREWAEKK